MGFQEARVNSWYSSEEGNFLGGGRRREVRTGEARPDGRWIERKEELNGRTSEERCDYGVDDPMDVVQREDMKEMVRGGILPSNLEGF